MSVLTLRPDAGKPGTTCVDGNISYEGAASYATAHDGDGTNADPFNIQSLVVSNRNVGGGAPYYVARSLIFFDASALPVGASVSSAVLRVYCTVRNDGGDGDSISVVKPSIVSNVDYAVTDFSLIGTVKQATDILVSSLTPSAYNDFTLNGTGLGNIVTGIIKLGLRTAKDIANVTPTGDTYTRFSAADETGTGQDPELVITYTAGGGASTGNFFALF